MMTQHHDTCDLVVTTCLDCEETKKLYYLQPIKELKQSRNRPGVVQSVPGVLRSQISMTFGT